MQQRVRILYRIAVTMEYNSVSKNEQEGISVEILLVYIQKILKKWWVIAASAVLLAAIGFATAKLTYVPKYSSSIMFNAINRDVSLVSSGQSNADLNASVTLAENFKYVFTTTELSQKVASNCGYKNISVSEIKSFVSVEAVENTSIICLTVTTPTDDPEVPYAIANTYMRFYEETITNAFPNTTLKVIDPPLLPEEPNANNNTIVYTAIGFLLGIFLSVFGMIAFFVFKDTVIRADDIKGKLGLKIIGSVNRAPVKKKKGEKSSILITDRRSGFAFIEAFKLIRTKLEHILMRKGQKALVVTSTVENEGKTTVAINIALALAKNGKEVLLIDGDLRKPAVAKALSINAADDTGVLGVVNGSKSLADSIKYSEKFNLYLLLNGKGISEPSEVLSTTQMEEIIQAAKREFDYVVVDTAPCGVVADASILASFCDAIVMVVRQDTASKRRISRALDNLDNSGTEVIGCVYNDAKADISERGAKRKYGYGYGYGYGDNKIENK